MTAIFATIAKETEKAYNLTVNLYNEKNCNYRDFNFWTPKSVTTIGSEGVVEIADWKLVQAMKDYQEFTHLHPLQVRDAFVNIIVKKN